MNNKNFSKDILEKIKKDNIKQTPKYIFLIKNYIFWFFLAITIIIWAISLSITFAYLFNADWDLFRKIWLYKVFFIFLPFFWFIFLIISSLLSYYNYRHTDKWYKLSIFKVFLINIFSSFLLWLIFFFSWFSSLIESKIENIMPKYRSIFVEDREARMISVWQNEDNGLLIWDIMEVLDNRLILVDTNNKIWDILMNNSTNIDIKHNVSIQVWERIKIVWEKNDNTSFLASEIRPFMWWKWKNKN